MNKSPKINLDFGPVFWIQSNLLVIVGALAGMGSAPSASRRGHAIGFRMCGPKSRIRVDLHNLTT